MKTFTDPIVRCVDCQRIIFRHEIQEFGMCPGCGTKRVKNVLLLTEEEMKMLEEKYYDFCMCFDPKIVGKETIWIKSHEVNYE